MKNAFVIGRFQPLHNGHLSLIEAALGMADVVHIVIGSPNMVPDFKNPLTFAERVHIVSGVLGSDPKIRIHSLDDEPSNEQWVMAVNALVNNLTDYGDPQDSGIFCGTKDKDFYEENFVIPVYSVDCDGPSGTAVRTAAYRGLKDNYEPYLPPASLAAYREHIGSEEFSRLQKEYEECTSRKAEATLAHKFSNPIEPVVHAALVQEEKILLVQRNSVRGHGQWALPGGFLESTETTIEGAVRELKEETGVTLEGKKAMLLSTAVEENIADLSVRTLGINYLFLAHADEDLEITFDPSEVLACEWKDVKDVLSGELLLFYNHNTVVRRLFASVPEKFRGEAGDEQ